MKIRNLFYLIGIVLFLYSCKEGSKGKESDIKPLQPVYEYFDQLSNGEFHFAELEHQLNTARGKNNTDDINKYTKEFEDSHNLCIQKMGEKYPSGSVKIPFEQIHGKDTVTVNSVYVSGYSFPWSTSTTICFYFTVEYDVHKKDLVYIPLSLRFLDIDEDIIHFCHIPCNDSGKTQFLVKAQFTFRNFNKIIINQ
jgi:hypothetical protein